MHCSGVTVRRYRQKGKGLEDLTILFGMAPLGIPLCITWKVRTRNDSFDLHRVQYSTAHQDSLLADGWKPNKPDQFMKEE